MTETERILRRLCVEKALALEPHVLLLFLVDVPGVVIPEPVRAGLEAPVLGLNVGLNTLVPVDSLETTEVGISGVFSFSRIPGFCGFPWESLVQLTLVDGDDNPRGAISFSVSLPEKPGDSLPEPPPAVSGKPCLKLV